MSQKKYLQSCYTVSGSGLTDTEVIPKVTTIAEVKCVKIRLNCSPYRYPATTLKFQSLFLGEWTEGTWWHAEALLLIHISQDTALCGWLVAEQVPRAVTNGHPAWNYRLARTAPRDLNPSWALQFIPQKMVSIFNLHPFMTYRKGKLVTAEKITKFK